MRFPCLPFVVTRIHDLQARGPGRRRQKLIRPVSRSPRIRDEAASLPSQRPSGEAVLLCTSAGAGRGRRGGAQLGRLPSGALAGGSPREGGVTRGGEGRGGRRLAGRLHPDQLQPCKSSRGPGRWEGPLHPRSLPLLVRTFQEAEPRWPRKACPGDSLRLLGIKPCFRCN